MARTSQFAPRGVQPLYKSPNEWKEAHIEDYRILETKVSTWSNFERNLSGYEPYSNTEVFGHLARFLDITSLPSGRGEATEDAESLRQRLSNANDYFQRKASEVFNDEDALKLLAAMYKDVVIEASEFDGCKNGVSMAKLTAANFCEIGANVIYITEAGQRFIEAIRDA